MVRLHYVSEANLEHLAKLESIPTVNHSMLVVYIMKPVWKWLASMLPNWMSPNLITLAGFAFAISAYVLVAYETIVAPGRVPAWVYGWSGVGLFTYQMLAAVDWHQAKRIGYYTPLAKIFNQGCDAIVTMSCGFLLVDVFQLRADQDAAALAVAISLPVAYYFATWEEAHTGLRKMNIINADGLVAIYVIAFITSAEGPAFWLAPSIVPFMDQISPKLGFTILNQHTGVVVTVLLALSAIGRSSVAVVYRTWRNTQAQSSAFNDLCPLLAAGAFFLLWAFTSPAKLLERQPRLMLALFPLLVCNLVSRLALARLCHDNIELFQTLLMPLPFACLNALGAATSSRKPLVNEEVLLIGYFLAALAIYIHFSSSVARDISKHLKISLLFLPDKRTN